MNVAVLLLAILVALGAAASAQPTSILLSVELPVSPTAGARVFAQKSCIRCHSLAGGEARLGPDLGTIPRLDDPIAIIAAMWNHAPTMERELRTRGLTWPRFEQGEPADLTAFLLTSRTAAGEARAANK